MVTAAVHDQPRVDLDTEKIKSWRSIVTLILFVVTNIIVLIPFSIPIWVPRRWVNALLNALSAMRIISPRKRLLNDDDQNNGKEKPFMRLNFPMNFVTAPLIADLFLLAILAIGRTEVHDGTLGANHISPIDIMVFFLTLAYIAISIDASGLIRYLAFKVLQWGGKVGHKLFFYLYAFFFCLGSFIGNDPIILSGTAFLAYMTRVSSNIVHPRAWIHTQFAVANIASAILVSSNPTNLVLAGAFQIKFIVYTANMIVPVLFTIIILFPFLLYIVFANEDLIPLSIKMHELPEEALAKKPVNPNIPNARGTAGEEEGGKFKNDEEQKLLSLEEIMNPFLDKTGAAFGACIMTATLVTLLAINAASQSSGEHAVYWVTLPAAFVQFCWDLGFGWYHRAETREIAKRRRGEIERARAKRAVEEEDERRAMLNTSSQEHLRQSQSGNGSQSDEVANLGDNTPPMADISDPSRPTPTVIISEKAGDQTVVTSSPLESSPTALGPSSEPQNAQSTATTIAAIDENRNSINDEDGYPLQDSSGKKSSGEMSEQKEEPDFEKRIDLEMAHRQRREGTTLVSLVNDGYRWSRETFPTVTAVLGHLPFALVPFAFAMFVLVQALVTKGWVPVFAYGWDHWVEKTGTVGAIGGMGFLSVILCNFAGTNIGTTILLSRVIQAWKQIHDDSGVYITDRTFWATVYSMALGVNYGAFSTAFSASLAGLLWRDILARKHIHVKQLEFARENLPIIAIAMTVGCVVLVAEVYIIRDNSDYNP